MSNESHFRLNSRRIMGLLAPIILGILVLLLVLPVLIEFGRSFVDYATQDVSGDLTDRSGFFFNFGSRALLFGRSILIASLIALIGLVLGLPLANLVTGHKSRVSRVLVVVFIAPALLPSALLYASGNLLRAPDTIIGRSIISFSTSDPDLRWITIWLGYLIAILSLSIWVSPISAILLSSGFGVRTNLYREMMMIEPIGWVRRTILYTQIHRAALLRTWIFTLILMLGSAVPMHLAGLETYSIVIWRSLAETIPDQWWEVWIMSWPMVLVAIVGGSILTRELIRSERTVTQDHRGTTPLELSKPIWISALFVWILGSCVPLFSLLITLDDLNSIRYFWTIKSQAVLDSGSIAIFTGVFGLMIAFLTCVCLSHPSLKIRRIGAYSLWVLIVLGLLPGVLVGAAIARSSMPWISDPWLAASIATSTRSAFLGAIIGALCAWSESDERRFVRWQLVGGSIGGWARSTLPLIYKPMIGAFGITWLYAFYEIEASVLVRSPGMDNLAQQLLSDMHYARIEQLSAAGINLFLIGLVCSIVVCLLVLSRNSERD